MVIAFIPVRGGSKSIPLKNIKPFCGKPLVCWNIEALEQCKEVDEIIVATDSDKIEEVVVSRPYKKTKIYRRSAKNACDTASTESEKNEICKGYADLILRKEKLIREIWETEFSIRKLEDILTRNRVLKPTETEGPSETDPTTL